MVLSSVLMERLKFLDENLVVYVVVVSLFLLFSVMVLERCVFAGSVSPIFLSGFVLDS